MSDSDSMPSLVSSPDPEQPGHQLHSDEDTEDSDSVTRESDVVWKGKGKGKGKGTDQDQGKDNSKSKAQGG